MPACPPSHLLQEATGCGSAVAVDCRTWASPLIITTRPDGIVGNTPPPTHRRLAASELLSCAHKTRRARAGTRAAGGDHTSSAATQMHPWGQHSRGPGDARSRAVAVAVVVYALLQTAAGAGDNWQKRGDASARQNAHSPQARIHANGVCAVRLLSDTLLVSWRRPRRAATKHRRARRNARMPAAPRGRQGSTADKNAASARARHASRLGRWPRAWGAAIAGCADREAKIVRRAIAGARARGVQTARNRQRSALPTAAAALGQRANSSAAATKTQKCEDEPANSGKKARGTQQQLLRAVPLRLAPRCMAGPPPPK